ncbi:FKBP-type peptidyl-prolyl cis-trans isomerase FkpA precursor [Filimonas lacunae]|nr:FKBP-type peptidyl-prolyl cis-trans isomerase FkpA precursor [Filimonas lacunae]
MAPETELPQMKAFCTANNIEYTQLSNGLLYQVVDSGSGTAPANQSVIYVIYKGTLLNGTVFDQTNTAVKMNLSNLIEGWKVGLPLIKRGGHIKLIIPSYLGYGCAELTGIPANSALYFDIKLTDVQ